MYQPATIFLNLKIKTAVYESFIQGKLTKIQPVQGTSPGTVYHCCSNWYIIAVHVAGYSSKQHSCERPRH
jgi:hypothetical protein